MYLEKREEYKTITCPGRLLLSFCLGGDNTHLRGGEESSKLLKRKKFKINIYE